MRNSGKSGKNDKITAKKSKSMEPTQKTALPASENNKRIATKQIKKLRMKENKDNINNARLDYFDIAKGLAMFCVIAGHMGVSQALIVKI